MYENRENPSENNESAISHHFLPLAPLIIPVIREVLVVDKQAIETGKVRISKKTYHDQAIEQIELMAQKVSVERRQINEYVDSAPAVRYENGVTIIPVIKEVLVTEKRMLLVEEIHICSQTTSRVAEVNQTLLRQEIEVVRTDSGTDVYEA